MKQGKCFIISILMCSIMFCACSKEGTNAKEKKNETVQETKKEVLEGIDSSRTISGQHCEFYVKSNRFFVRDLNSINHTYLDGKMIRGEAEVVSGSIVKLGEAEFCIEIMPI